MADQIVILALEGKWRDTRGSRYELVPDTPANSLTVHTTRPDGSVRTTRALIRLEPSGTSDLRIAWGTSFVLDHASLFSNGWPPSSLQWVRTNKQSSPFVWQRDTGEAVAPRVVPALLPTTVPAVLPAAVAGAAAPGLVGPRVIRPLRIVQPPVITPAKTPSLVAAAAALRAITARSRSPPKRADVQQHGTVLPHPWEEHFCDEYQVPYYWNPTTGESLWEPPVA